MRGLATLTYLHARTLLVAAVLLLVLAGVASQDIFDRVAPFAIDDPESESVQARQAFEELTGETPDPEVMLLVSPDAEHPGSPADAARSLAGVEGVARVRSPQQEPGLVSADGRSFLVLGHLDPGASRIEVGGAVSERFAPGSSVQPGGMAVAAHEVAQRSEEDARRIELYAAPLLLLLLLVVFRTLAGALLPLLVAALTILLTFAALRLITEVTPIDLFSLQIVTGLGVGLAIDYSLFVLSRYREEMSQKAGYAHAHRRAIATAGRTVAFSAATVAAALASLIIFPQQFLHSTGVAGALTALFAGCSALLVLPAALALLGPSVNSLGVRRDRRASAPGGSPFWDRLAAGVCRRPWASLIGGGAVMLLVASPSLGIRLTTPDARELPADSSARVVADAAERFPARSPSSLYGVMPSSADERLLRRQIESINEISAVSLPDSDGATSQPIVISAAVDPLSESGQRIVSEIRDILPAGSLLGGRAAELADQRASVAAHTPVAIAIVVMTSLVLLAAMTRSLVLPFVALFMNILTVGASLGVTAWAFDTRWVTGLLGTDVPAGIDISVPALASAVIFGLSTDYGILLLARIKEARGTAKSETEAIRSGVAAAGHLITACALLLAIAVGAFVFSDVVIIKEFAVAVAVAVLLDATLVRALLIPASLRLLGRMAWWPQVARAHGAPGAFPAAGANER